MGQRLKLNDDFRRKIIKIFLIFACVVCAIEVSVGPMQYKDVILKYSMENELDPYLVYAIINVESNFDPSVKSNADAKGLMQIMNITADWAKEHIELEELNEEDYYNVDTNIKIGCWYLSKLSAMYDGDIKKIASAYNAGTGNLEKWINEGYDISNGDIPFEETKKYVNKVESNMRIYRVLYGDDYSKKDAITAIGEIAQTGYEKANRRGLLYFNKHKDED